MHRGGGGGGRGGGGGGEGGRGGGGGRGRGGIRERSGADSWAMPRRGGRGGGVVRANLANPHGADLTKYLKKGAPKPEFKKSRAAEPTVDQIQVNIKLFIYKLHLRL